MNDEEKLVSERLSQLKSGVILVKRKLNGKKYPRRFFLNEHEDYITYEKSRRICRRPHRCKYTKKSTKLYLKRVKEGSIAYITK